MLINNQKGGVSVEWVLVMLAVVVALFIPIPGTTPPQNIIGLTLESLRDFYSHVSYLYSLP